MPRVKTTPDCGFDCFNCIYPDCRNQSAPPTKWECDILRYIHGYGTDKKDKKQGGRWSD